MLTNPSMEDQLEQAVGIALQGSADASLKQQVSFSKENKDKKILFLCLTRLFSFAIKSKIQMMDGKYV